MNQKGHVQSYYIHLFYTYHMSLPSHSPHPLQHTHTVHTRTPHNKQYPVFLTGFSLPQVAVPELVPFFFFFKTSEFVINLLYLCSALNYVHPQTMFFSPSNTNLMNSFQVHKGGGGLCFFQCFQMSPILYENKSVDTSCEDYFNKLLLRHK